LIKTKDYLKVTFMQMALVAQPDYIPSYNFAELHTGPVGTFGKNFSKIEDGRAGSPGSLDME